MRGVPGCTPRLSPRRPHAADRPSPPPSGDGRRSRGDQEPRPWLPLPHERGVVPPACRTRPVRPLARPPSQPLPSAVGLRVRWRHMAGRATAVPSTDLDGFSPPSVPSSLRAASVGALEGGRTHRGRQSLWMTFHQPLRSAPTVPNLPGDDRPLAPPPLGSAGGGRRGSLNGRSGAAGLRCWRGLPKSNPRSSALLALRSGPLVKAAHPSAQKNSRRMTIFLAPGWVLAGGGRRPCPGVDATCHQRWRVCTASDLDQGSLGLVGTLKEHVVCSFKKGGQA
jgi:hypothetical protein